MGADKRKHRRFSDYAKVSAQEICVFPGVLCDISETGCLVRFPFGAQADSDSDYEITVTPTRKQGMTPFKLIVRPVRVQTANDSCEIGFQIMRSPGTPQLMQYLKILNTSESDSYEMMVYEACLPA